jgi:FecR protein
MEFRPLTAIVGLGLALIFSAGPASAREVDNSSPERAVPGTLNYVEGQVAIGSQAVTARSIGSAGLADGQSLTTNNGKAEILLTPGVFLRVGDNSSVQMISSSLTNTEVGLNEGEAMVEVDEIHPENDIRVSAGGNTAELLKTGLYDFDLNHHQFRVFEGKAQVEEGDGRHVDVKGGHAVALEANENVKAKGFDKKAFEEDDLYRWSSLRSAYVAESNVGAASAYYESGWGPWGPGWWGAGWYWDPWFYGYTFIPGDGIFYSPFGWGFYSPWWVYRAPFYGAYGFRAGIYHHFSADCHSWGPGAHYIAGAHYAHGVYTGVGSAGAFHSGGRAGAYGGGLHGGGGMRGGGFGGGGFHGGGGGGGAHGR